MKRKLLVVGVVWMVFVHAQVFGQSLEIKNIEFKSNRFVVHYDIVDSIADRSYTIRVYSSVDGFVSPLQKIQGDAGVDINAGKHKKLEWAVLEELGASFEGNVTLELRGRIYIPFIKTESINQYKVFKRGRNYNLTWSGGSEQNVLNFDLYRGDRKIFSFPNIGNAGHHSFKFPTHVKPGKNYRFRISDSKNKDEVVYTDVFKIKRRVPLAIKAVPILALGSVVYMVLNKKEEDEGIPNPSNHP
jgi:hypothetical protein